MKNSIKNFPKSSKRMQGGYTTFQNADVALHEEQRKKKKKSKL